MVRWEKDATFCHDRLLEPTSEYYHGILEFTDAAIFDFLMGKFGEAHGDVIACSRVRMCDCTSQCLF